LEYKTILQLPDSRQLIFCTLVNELNDEFPNSEGAILRSKKKNVSRRNFIKQSSLGLSASTLGLGGGILKCIQCYCHDEQLMKQRDAG